jgi:pyridoxine 4-dehydrogenase
MAKAKTDKLSAAGSGEFRIGAVQPVRRLGFGAMRITGHGIWGEPDDKAECLKVLRRLPELGVNLIDTADSYGPEVSENLIAEALHPYPSDMVIATKAGLTRQGPDKWAPVGRPEYLRQCLEMSLRRLKVDHIDLYQLHRIDTKVPAAEQFEALKQFQEEGKVRHIGLSEVSVTEIKHAREFFKVATVQNLYNLVNRKSEAVLDYCEMYDIGFIPWFPVASGDLARPGGVLDEIAKNHEGTVAQLALAWLLKRSPVILPIPGTSSVAHLEENVGAAQVTLTEDEFHALEAAGRGAAETQPA